MKKRGALLTLCDFALRSAQTVDDRLAIYQALAALGGNDEFAQLAERAALAIRKIDEAEANAAKVEAELGLRLRDDQTGGNAR